MTTVTEVQSASFELVLHAQHIFANSFVSSTEGYHLQFSIPHAYSCIFCVYGMALYWPTLQFYLCMLSFVCRYVAPLVSCYYNTVLYNAACVHAVSLNCAKNI